MTPRRVLLTCSGVLLATTPLFGGSQPLSVSPGDTTRVVQIGDVCPTFNWGFVAEARSYQLVVYRLMEEEPDGEARPVVRATLPGSAQGWTPALDQCLQRGARYAWSVRAVGEDETSAWSTPALFQVASPSLEEFEQALAVVRSYLASRDANGSAPGPAGDSEPAAESEPDRASAGRPTPRAAAPLALYVDQGIVAASFTGDGSTLTDLDPAALSSGTAAIDISGNAASATDADTLDTLDSAQFLRSDDDDSYSGETLTLGPATTLNVQGAIQMSGASGADNDAVYFDAGTLEHLLWHDSRNRFELSNDLALLGALQTGSTGAAPVTYNRLGAGVSDHALNSTSQLLVSSDLEVDGSAYLDGDVEVTGAGGLTVNLADTSGASTVAVAAISRSSGEGSAGVFGQSTATSGDVQGVHGSVSSPDGVGVIGLSNHAVNGVGVVGEAEGSGLCAGVAGLVESTTGVGGLFWNAGSGDALVVADPSNYPTSIDVKFAVDPQGNVELVGDLDVDGGVVVSDAFKANPTDTPGTCDATTEGHLYYDDSLAEPCFCNGTQWRQLDGGGTC